MAAAVGCEAPPAQAVTISTRELLEIAVSWEYIYGHKEQSCWMAGESSAYSVQCTYMYVYYARYLSHKAELTDIRAHSAYRC